MAFISVFIILALLVFCWRDTKRPKNFPPGPSWIPVFGNLLLIQKLRSICGFYHLAWHHLAKQFGPVVGLKVGRDRLIIVSGFEAIRQLYAADEFAGRPDGFFYRMRSFEKRLGVVFTDGAVWEQHRRFSLKTLRQLGMGRHGMVEHVEREAAEMVSHFQALVDGCPSDPDGKAIVGMDHAFDVPVLNVLWAMLAGHRFSLDDSRLTELLELIQQSFRVIDMTGGVLQQFPAVRFVAPNLCGYRPLVNNLNQMWNFLREVIADTEMSELADHPQSLIEAYQREILKNSLDRSTTFTDEQLLALCVDFFQAGTETTSNTLAFGIIYMIHHPDSLAKVYAELDAKIGRHRVPRLSDRSALPFTEAVLCEVQRMTNVAPVGVIHRCMETTKLGSFTIPKDTMALVSLYSLHMDDEYWRDPHTFRPERFINCSTGELMLHHDHFLPFGAGKRRCLGEQLAKSSMFLFFASFLHAFQIHPIDGEPLPDSVGSDGITLAPKPFNVILSGRKFYTYYDSK